MGRKSMADQRRIELVEAFSVVLAKHGFEGATMASVAEAAGVAPGLIHHYFRNKDELLLELVATLKRRFGHRLRTRHRSDRDTLEVYLEAALKRDENSDIRSAVSAP